MTSHPGIEDAILEFTKRAGCVLEITGKVAV